MNITIAAYGFTGSTLPLVKRFLEMGHQVSVYYFINPGFSSLEAFDFHKRYYFPGVYDVKIEETSLKNYFTVSTNVKIYLSVLIRKRRKLPLFINRVIDKIDYHTLDSVARRINNGGYDVVNIVGHMAPMDYLAKLFPSSKTYISLHEIFTSQNSKELTPVAQWAINNKSKIIVHSKYIYNEITKYGARATHIYFGMFESFLSFYSPQIAVENYVLYYGHILPYKGLGILLEAISFLDQNIKFVVAGGGYDSSLDKLMKLPNVIILNKYIKNAELVSLISRARIVVCPYMYASQSGVPQTANLFRKLVIATDVGAFPESILNGINGFIVPANQPRELANCIKNVFDSGASEVSGIPETWDWNKIARDYLLLFGNKQYI